MIRNLLLLLFPIFIFSQKTILLKGKILSMDNKPIIEAHIYNKRSLKGTLTNTKGEFNIEVKLDDVLFISAMPYESKELYVNNKEVQSAFLVIQMIEDITSLEEVKVNSHQLVGNLSIDSEKAPTDVNASYKVKISAKNNDFNSLSDTGNGVDRGNEEVRNAGKKLYKGANFLGLFVDAYNIISKNKKYVRKKPRTFTKETPNNMRKELGDDFFIKELLIPKTQIDYFLEEYCNTKEFIDLYEENKIIECIEYLFEKNKLKKYVKI